MAASFEDAKTGWDIMLASGFSLTRDELNTRLTARGMKTISLRTFAHYNKLRRYGYSTYIPINQLDVKTLKDPLWDQAVRGRYTTFHVSAPVNVVGMHDDDEFDIPGRTTELSSSFVTVRVDAPETVERLADKKFQRGLRARRVFVQFPKTDEIFPGRVEDITHHLQEEAATLTVGFVSLASIERTTGQQQLPSAQLAVEVTPTTADSLLSQVVQRLYWLFQALDTSKVITEELLNEVFTDHTFAVPPVRVASLTMDTSLKVTIAAGTSTLLLASKLAEGLMHLPSHPFPHDRPQRKSHISKAHNDVFAQVYEHVKEHLIATLVDHHDVQQNLPLEPIHARTVELAQNQLLPSLNEFLDPMAGTVTMHLVSDPETMG